MLEWVLLALVGLPVVSSRRIDRYQLVHLLVWLHLALTIDPQRPVLRHGGGPGAGHPDRRPAAVVPTVVETRRSPSIWPALATIVLAGPGRPRRQAGRLRPEEMALAAMATLNRQPTSARLFHEQDWGGLIEAECAAGPADVCRRPIRALRQGGDRRVCRRPDRRPGVGHGPRPRPDRPGLAPPRPRTGQTAAQGAGVERALSRQGVDPVPTGAIERPDRA